LRWQPRHSARTRAAAGRETIFVLGSPAPHKNIGLLLGLAGDFAEAGLRLAIAGMSDSRVFKAAPEGGEAGNVIWLGRVSDDEIAALLGDCLCLAFPSFVEGFGLRAVEAMAWSCPVVASDKASLPEVCGEAALYASPDEPAAWRDQIIRLSRDGTLRDGLVEKGRARMQKFNWRRSAEQYLQAMADADGCSQTAQTARDGNRSANEEDVASDRLCMSSV
jgi:glycosyltransferase involved in cell wall biosynthesis